MFIDFGKFLELRTTIFKGLLVYYGVGFSIAAKCCKLIGVSKTLLIEELSAVKKEKLKLILSSKFVLETRLKNLHDAALRKILGNDSFRGIRLVKGLPVRGQGSRSNARTAKRRKAIYINMNVKQDS